MTYSTFISPRELMVLIGRHENLSIFDARFSLADTEAGRRSYLSGHIPGAVYAHLDEDLSGPVQPGKTGRHPLPDPAEFANQLGRWGVGNQAMVVTYDDENGGIAARLWWMLRWLGHDRTAVLDGGWRAWLAAGGPVGKDFPSPKPVHFKPRLRENMTSSANEIMAMRKPGEFTLVDSRTADRFAGENETIDPIAGPIPGAINASYTDTVNPDGTSLSTEDLRKWFHSKLKTTSPEKTIFYCGSGVTACRNVLAMEYAGLHGSTVYPGSWSEWIHLSSDIATGAE